MEAEQAKIAKAYRYENRKSIDELLRKLLNGDLFDIFSQSKQDQFPEVPSSFQDHNHYLDVWDYLFSYEVYSLLMNSRRADSKDERPNQAGLENFGSNRENKKKQLMWVGYCVTGPQ